MPDARDDPPATIRQPGPAVAGRIVAVPGSGRALVLDLPARVPLVQAVHRAFAARGFIGGTVAMDGVALGPFAYVQPALARTPQHAAYYSDTIRPSGVTRLDHGAMTFGRREGTPFFHCHAAWVEADGRRSGGHILPEGTVLAAPASVPGFGFAGGIFEAEPDPETNFTLFGPVPAEPSAFARDARAHALRLRPNQDLCGALERYCAAHGILAARIHGGVGSTIGARFADGTVVRPFATEAFIRHGMIGPGTDGGPEAMLEVAQVDCTGALAAGRMRRGANPVLMTYELVLEVLDWSGMR